MWGGMTYKGPHHSSETSWRAPLMTVKVFYNRTKTTLLRFFFFILFVRAFIAHAASSTTTIHLTIFFLVVVLLVAPFSLSLAEHRQKGCALIDLCTAGTGRTPRPSRRRIFWCCIRTSDREETLSVCFDDRQQWKIMMGRCPLCLITRPIYGGERISTFIILIFLVYWFFFCFIIIITFLAIGFHSKSMDSEE